MASAHPLRSLMRPGLPGIAHLRPSPRALPALPVPAASSSPFTTSAPLAATAAPPAVKSRRDLPKQMKKTYKKKVNITPVKKPQPGERKAFRKRIQLSNNSALPVPGLDTLAPETLARADSGGRMFAIPDGVVDQLRALEAFKTTQTWNLFRRPHVLVRRETVELARMMEDAAREKQGLRCVLTGSKLSGKSLALLQAMSYALLNQWVVVHIPEGQDLTNGNTEYSPIPDSTEPVQFTQPIYCLKLLHAIHQANKPVLDALTLSKDTLHLKQGAPLSDLLLAAKETDLAWPTLSALWAELLLPGRPPVLLALDGLAHVNRVSDYRDPDFRPVHAHDLVLVRLFVDALAGATALPNGGAVLAATSENNTLRHPSQDLALARIEACQAGEPEPQADAYEKKYDTRVAKALEACRVLRLEGLSRDEARVLMEYWAASGMLRSVLNTRTVAEKWALGGHGIVGEMERASLMTMRM